MTHFTLLNLPKAARRNFWALTLAAITVSLAFQSGNRITRRQAIRLAEQFVIDNGYTALPADTSKIHGELFDQFETSLQEVLAQRQNMLQKKAFCISEDEDRWNIGFLISSTDLRKLSAAQRKTNLPGRAVIVMKNGREVYMAHKTPNFSNFKKLKRDAD